jgi:hypothetical protein
VATTHLSLSRRSRGLARDRRRQDTSPVVKCQICKSATVPGLDLGHQPVGDLLLVRSQLNEPETSYPIQLHHCNGCGLTQLGYTVNPRIVYKHFPFVSGTTQTATKHLQSLPRHLVEMGVATPQSFAVDIGSNDGTLLKGYLAYGVKFLGVDPAGEACRIAAAEGVPTLHAFFNEETAECIVNEHGQSGAITACGVFAHIADLTGVMRGVKTLLARRGVFATDSQYWLDMVVSGHYDNMFHQHLRYYAMKPLIRLFHDYEMDVFDVERSGVYGGSIRVFCCHTGEYPISNRVSDLVALEGRERLYEEPTYLGYAKTIEERRRRFFEEVYQLAAVGKKIIGIGAPAKASTVCNYCRLGPDLVEYITEINPLRIGKYLPGVHIPIVAEETMFTDERPADAAILFAWNYYDEIMPKLRQRGFAGQVLLP